jgi:tetratricopeptide (TPR) repeat protein
MRLASPRQRPPCAMAARAFGASLLGVALLVGRAPSALALDSDDARADAVRQIQSVRAELARLVPGVVAQRRAARSTEKMIASGDLALRAKDYEQAIDIFNQVVELYRQGKATPNAHADGLFLLAQAYFESGQLLSARRHYTELLDQAKSAPYDSYAGRSLARLVDVAVQTNRLDTLDAIAARVDALPAADPTGSFEYARGKLSLARGRFDEALAILGAVAAESPYFPQAR